METAGSSGNCPSNRRISIVFGPGADLGGRSELPLRIVLRLRVTFRESTACSDELDLLGRCVLPRDRHAKCRTAVVDLDQRRLVLERAALDLPDDGHPAAEPRGRHEEVRRLQDENERLDARVRDVGDRHGDVSEPCGVSLVCVPQADVGRAEQAAPQRIARRRVELREAGESGRAAEIDVGVELDERVLGEIGFAVFPEPTNLPRLRKRLEERAHARVDGLAELDLPLDLLPVTPAELQLHPAQLERRRDVGARVLEDSLRRLLDGAALDARQ